MLDMQEALDVATDIAVQAGSLLAERYEEIHVRKQRLQVREKGSPLSLVTDVDTVSQQLIVDALHERFPEHRFTAEEEGVQDLGDPASPYTWIIDPLDGTTCFVHGRTNFGVMIALQRESTVELGVIVLPMKQMVFVGRRGHGVTCNGAPLRLRATRDLSDAILCTNTIRRARKGPDGILRIPTPSCASLENYGSAAEQFAEMLLGHNDGAFYDGIRLWDVAAGCLMVEELGGRSRAVFQEPGNPKGGMLVVVSTAPIFDDLERIVFDERLTER